MKQKVLLMALLLLPLAITGCWDQKIIEKKAFITELGLEPTHGSEFLLTIVAPQFNHQGDQSNELLTTQARLIGEGLRNANLSTGGDIETGKIQHVLFSEELARQGIHPLLEVFERDPLLPLQSSLVVVEGSPNRLLSKLCALRNKPRISFYLGQLLMRNAAQSDLPPISSGDFEIDYFTPGIDPVLPMIKQVDDGITMTGTALFAKDRMVGKLDPQQTALLMAIMNRLRRTELIFKSAQWIQKGENLKRGIVITINQAHRRLFFKLRGNQPPAIRMTLYFKGDLLEYQWDRLDDKKKYTAIEKKLSAEIKSACQQIIRYTQQVGSDPIGFGDEIRAGHYAYWKKINWISAYRDAKITVNVQLKLLHYGLIH